MAKVTGVARAFRHPRYASSRRRAVVIGACAVAVLVAGGCGSRQSRSDIEAAASSSGTPVAANDSSGPVGGAAAGPETTFGTAPTETVASGGGSATTVAMGSGGAASSGSAGATSGAAAPAPSSSSGTSGGAAAAGAPIVIGNVSTTSGIAGTAQVPGVRALQAWVAMINSRGGINGHPVKLVIADDAGDPARQAAAVKDLVENKGVIAFVDDWASQTSQASRPYLEQRRIPVVGGDASTNTWFSSPMLFPYQPPSDIYMQARLKALASFTKNRKIATIVCQEAAVCSEQAASTKRFAAQFGFQVVYQGQGSLAQPDFTAECISARSAGADIILPVFDAATQRRIAQSCDRQGYKPHYNLSAAIDPDFASIPAFEGATMSMGSFPFDGTDSPVVREYKDALAKYTPGQVAVPIGAAGWASSKMFEKVATMAFTAGAKPTTQALLNALWTIHNDNFGGVVGPMTFPRDKPPIPSRCLATIVISGGRYTAPNGMAMTCV